MLNRLVIFLGELVLKLLFFFGIWLHGRQSAKNQQQEKTLSAVKAAKEAKEKYERDPTKIHEKYDRDLHGRG